MSEPNDGRGYIKELSVSPDGRYICSSFGYGVRLLTFNTDCSELCDLNPTGGNSKELTEKCLLISHKRTVVTSEFSPTHPTLVTGCLEGELVFHQARLWRDYQTKRNDCGHNSFNLNLHSATEEPREPREKYFGGIKDPFLQVDYCRKILSHFGPSGPTLAPMPFVIGTSVVSEYKALWVKLFRFAS